jgi:hypothetical protein
VEPVEQIPLVKRGRPGRLPLRDSLALGRITPDDIRGQTDLLLSLGADEIRTQLPAETVEGLA